MKNLNILKFLGKYPNHNVNRISYDSNLFAGQKKNKLNSTAYKGYSIEDEMDEELLRYEENKY